MAKANNQQPGRNDDFDPQQLTTTTDEHTKQLSDLEKRVKTLEETVASPDKLGELIATSVTKSTPLRQKLGELLIELFKDSETKDKLKKVFSKIDRESFWRWGKYCAGAVLWLATVAAAVLAYEAIKHH